MMVLERNFGGVGESCGDLQVVHLLISAKCVSEAVIPGPIGGTGKAEVVEASAEPGGGFDRVEVAQGKVIAFGVGSGLKPDGRLGGSGRNGNRKRAVVVEGAFRGFSIDDENVFEVFAGIASLV